MKIKNQLPLERLIGKIDNDFNISESDWIPRVAAWSIDALAHMKVLPMEKKRRTKNSSSLLDLTYLFISNKDFSLLPLLSLASSWDLSLSAR